MWGLRGDAADAFDEIAPTLDIVFDPHQITAGVVVVLAGATISTDPNVPADRTALAATNTAMFTEYAEALAARDHPPIVVVQSNPVELGVKIFSRRLPRRSVLGAAGFSDSLRFGREVARDLGVARRDVRALVLGEHGDRMVPLWSQLQVRGRDAAEYAEQVRAGRQLSDLPDEIRAGKAQMLDLVKSGDIAAAYAYVESLPADVRFAVKPFFTHFTAGRTTEAATANAAAWLVSMLINGFPLMVSAQVRLEGDFHELHGVTAVPLILSPTGWSRTVAMDLAEDELDLLSASVLPTD